MEKNRSELSWQTKTFTTQAASWCSKAAPGKDWRQHPFNGLKPARTHLNGFRVPLQADRPCVDLVPSSGRIWLQGELRRWPREERLRGKPSGVAVWQGSDLVLGLPAWDVKGSINWCVFVCIYIYIHTRVRVCVLGSDTAWRLALFFWVAVRTRLYQDARMGWRCICKRELPFYGCHGRCTALLQTCLRCTVPRPNVNIHCLLEHRAHVRICQALSVQGTVPFDSQLENVPLLLKCPYSFCWRSNPGLLTLDHSGAGHWYKIKFKLSPIHTYRWPHRVTSGCDPSLLSLWRQNLCNSSPHHHLQIQCWMSLVFISV